MKTTVTARVRPIIESLEERQVLSLAAVSPLLEPPSALFAIVSRESAMPIGLAQDARGHAEAGAMASLREAIKFLSALERFDSPLPGSGYHLGQVLKEAKHAVKIVDSVTAAPLDSLTTAIAKIHKAPANEVRTLAPNLAAPIASATDAVKPIRETLVDDVAMVIPGAKPGVEATIGWLEPPTVPQVLVNVPITPSASSPPAPGSRTGLSVDPVFGAVSPVVDRGNATFGEAAGNALRATPLVPWSPGDLDAMILPATPGEHQEPESQAEWIALMESNSAAGLAQMEVALDDLVKELNATCATLLGLLTETGTWPCLLMALAVIVSMQEVARARRKQTPLERTPLGLQF
jgi:hypothetical protein